MEYTKIIEEFIISCQEGYYFLNGFHLCVDRNKYSLEPAYIIDENDFYYNKENNYIFFNVGKYHNKNISKLLQTLFQSNMIYYNLKLLDVIKQENIKLILKNENDNLDDIFFDKINDFFYSPIFKPIYEGFWK